MDTKTFITPIADSYEKIQRAIMQCPSCHSRFQMIVPPVLTDYKEQAEFFEKECLRLRTELQMKDELYRMTWRVDGKR